MTRKTQPLDAGHRLEPSYLALAPGRVRSPGNDAFADAARHADPHSQDRRQEHTHHRGPPCLRDEPYGSVCRSGGTHQRHAREDATILGRCHIEKPTTPGNMAVYRPDCRRSTSRLRRLSARTSSQRPACSAQSSRERGPRRSEVQPGAPAFEVRSRRGEQAGPSQHAGSGPGSAPVRASGLTHEFAQIALRNTRGLGLTV